MKEIVEFLQHENIVFKSLNGISPKELGSRKKISLYVGVDLKGYYSLVMQIEKKSRILRKEAMELMGLHEKLERYIDTKISRKYIIIKAPFCSKAKAWMEEHGWRVFHVA